MQKVLILLTIVLFSCNEPRSEVKTLDLGSFKFNAPLAWHIVDTVTTIDTKLLGKPIKMFQGRIKIGARDTLKFELSRFAYIHAEYGFLVGGPDTTIFLTNDLDDTTDNNTYFGYPNIEDLPNIVKSMYSDVIVDGRNALLFKPVRSGIGVTGVRIDSLWQENESNVRFALSGKNLTPASEGELLKAIKTLQF